VGGKGRGSSFYERVSYTYTLKLDVFKTIVNKPYYKNYRINKCP